VAGKGGRDARGIQEDSMSKSIWKYSLGMDTCRSGDERQAVFEERIPRGATLLAVQTQNEVPCLWALVDVSAPKECRTLEIYGTGHTMPKDFSKRVYLGTFQLAGGRFIGHVFEVRS
jgi:hypothetical protein